MNQFIQEHAWLYLSGHPTPNHAASQRQDDAPTPPDGERAAPRTNFRAAAAPASSSSRALAYFLHLPRRRASGRSS
jgi:hypothetical protein